jgi:hypothetical protein
VRRRTGRTTGRGARRSGAAGALVRRTGRGARSTEEAGGGAPGRWEAAHRGGERRRTGEASGGAPVPVDSAGAGSGEDSGTRRRNLSVGKKLIPYPTLDF